MRSSIAVIILLAGTLLLHPGCESAQVVENEKTSNPEIVRAQNSFFDKEIAEGEYFRIFSSSENYVVRQVFGENELVMNADPDGQKMFMEEVSAFDKIDLFSEAIFRVEIFEESGDVAKIRTVRPMRVSELNKLAAEDITRLKFEISDELKQKRAEEMKAQQLKELPPITVFIRYGIYLQKKASRQDVTKIIQENAR